MGRFCAKILPSGMAKNDSEAKAFIKPIAAFPAFKYIAYTTRTFPVTSAKDAELRAEKIPYKRLP